MRSILLILFLSSSLWAYEKSDPTATVEEAVGKIVDIAIKMKSDEQDEARFDAFRKVFQQYFDVRRLSAMTLGGPAWKSLDKGQKSAYSKKFTDFVVSFYTGKLKEYDNNKIVYKEPRFKSKGKKAIVPSLIEYQGKMAKLNYSMVFKKGVWKMYDVEVEGIRLSSTYRSQFKDVLKKDKFEGLLKELDRLIDNQRNPEGGKTK